MRSENVPGIFRASDESCRLDIFGSVIIGWLPAAFVVNFRSQLRCALK